MNEDLKVKIYLSLKRAKEFFDTMPLFINIVLYSTFIIYILNLLISFISLILSDIPYYTIYYVQIWRLFTTPFMTTNILNLLLSYILWLREATKLEKELGTIKYMLIFFMNTFCIQLLYCFIMILLSLSIQNPLFLKNKKTKSGVVNQGLLPILLCDLTLLCLSNPERDMNFHFFKMKAKHYPFLLLSILILFNFSSNYEIISGFLFAFYYHKYLKNKIKISDDIAVKLSDSSLFVWMKNIKGYIKTQGIISKLEKAVEKNDLKTTMDIIKKNEVINNISQGIIRIIEGNKKAFDGKKSIDDNDINNISSSDNTFGGD